MVASLFAMIAASSAIQRARAQNTNSTTTVATNQSPSGSSGKAFYMFTAEHDGINETKLGFPANTFSPDILIVNNGDNLTILFYNLDTTDRHTFTIGAPYNVNEDLLPLHNGTITFKANQEGIFRFYCTYHHPTMAGQLTVLEPPTVEKLVLLLPSRM